jgi:hypothetical protein
MRFAVQSHLLVSLILTSSQGYPHQFARPLVTWLCCINKKANRFPFLLGASTLFSSRPLSTLFYTLAAAYIHTIAPGIFGPSSFSQCTSLASILPNPDFQLQKVASLIPISGQIPLIVIPASCCLTEAGAWPSKYLFIKFVEFKVAK